MTGILHSALVQGNAVQIESVSIVRGKDDVRVGWSLFGDTPDCPAGAVCIDRHRAITATLYGGLDLEREFRLGARATFHNATLAFEISRSGPHASVYVPLAQWLGLSRWVPVAAHADVSLDGVAFGPLFAPPKKEPAGFALASGL